MDNSDKLSSLIEESSNDSTLQELRLSVANLAASTFSDMGLKIYAAGILIGPDRVDNTSPFDYGTDEYAGVGLLLQIAGELTSVSATC